MVKKLLNITRNRKKKHKILMLAKSKLNSIETLISHALIDMDISHEEFVTNIKRWKESISHEEFVTNIKRWKKIKK